MWYHGTYIFVSVTPSDILKEISGPSLVVFVATKTDFKPSHNVF